MKRALSLVYMLAVCIAAADSSVELVYEDLAKVKAVDTSKTYCIGVSGVLGKVGEDHIEVTGVIPDSPADGQVQEGDLVRALQYRGIGGGPEGIRATVAKRIFRLGRDWDWHLYMTVERAGLRGGKGNTLTFDLRMPRPTDKTYHFGPTGFFGKIHPGFVEVDTVVETSPSDGKLKVGDRITAVAGKPVKGDVFGLFTKAIDTAEASKGILDLKVVPATDTNSVPRAPHPAPRTVSLQLQPLGSYSQTTPIQCRKTDTIITRTADSIVKNGKYGRLNTSLLGLMATGEKQYIDHVGKVIHGADWAKPDVELAMHRGYVSWPFSYQTMVLCEYYLLTGDTYVLPAINAYAKIIARGQDAAGLWNHRMANPDANFGKLHGRLYGYGAINQTSIALWIALILSEECGVKDAEVRAAVDKTYKLYSYWIERGKLPYGNHGAGEDFFTNNGTSGSVAVGFALLNDLKGASFFSRMSAAATQELLTGHTWPWFNIMWSGIGVNIAGPEATKAYSDKLHWFRTVTRTWDDRFLHMEAWGCKPGGYGLGSSGSTLLNLAAGRRKLRITGRGMDKSLWLDTKAPRKIVDAGTIDYSAQSVKGLLKLLGHELPPVRLRAAEMLAIKDAQVDDEVMKMLADGDRNQRIGAIHAISSMKIRAVDELMAIVRDTDDDLWIRQLALRTMTSLEGAETYAPELLDMLAGDKSYDVQGRFDEDLGSALVTLTDSDPYAAGFDKDTLYKAVDKLLDHKRQGARGSGMSLLEHMPLKDLGRVADRMIYVIEDKDRTYVSYHGDGHRQAGLNILYGLNIDESLDLTVNTINEPVGRGWRARNRKAFMKTWGKEAERVIPKIREVLGDEADEFVKIIEEADTGKKMMSLAEAEALGAEVRSQESGGREKK